MTQLPLFPLHLVLFPNFPLPLHVFEERYRVMIRRCIEASEPFGVVCQHGERYETVGCTAVVDRVLKEYDDGRMDIVTVGRERFAIDSVNDAGIYLEATVNYLEDPDEPEDQELLTKAIDALLRYAYHTEMDVDRDGLRELSTRDLSYLISGVDTLGVQTKQELLEMDSSTGRLRKSVDALEQVTEQLILLAQLQKTLGEDVDINSLTN
jgi:Lon protease-like protein